MEKLLVLNGCAIYLTRFNSEEPLLLEFIQVRYEVFQTAETTHYEPEPDSDDTHPDTRFLLVIDETQGVPKVVGGRRMLFHEPDSDFVLYAERNAHMAMQEMLPHLKTDKLRYVELGSFCLLEEYRGSGIASALYQVTFDYLKSRQVDFIVSQSVPSNVDRLHWAAEKNGAKQVILRFDVLTHRDEDRDPTSFISFRSQKELPLLAPTLKENTEMYEAALIS